MSNKGFSLIEMLIGIAMFAIMITGVYATFITFQKGGYEQIKRAKEGVRESVAMFRISKIVQSAGFGIRLADYQDTANSRFALLGDSDNITVYTLLGDRKDSGEWEVFPNNVRIPTGLRVSLDEDRNDSTASGAMSFRCKDTDNDGSCDNPYYYWINIGLSVTRNGLSTNDDLKNNCGEDTFNILYRRSSSDSGQPMLFCVADLRFEYGFEVNNNIVWDTDTTTMGRDLHDLKMVRIGYMIQKGRRTRKMLPDAPLRYSTFQKNNSTVTLNHKMRLYRWEIIEELIPITNL